MAVLQMTWQPSLSNLKRKSGPPLGLKNLGNTCYLNSVLQCLTYTPPLANFCLKNQHSSLCDSAVCTTERRDCPFCVLEKRIVRSLNAEFPLDSPSKINSCLRIFAEHFRQGRQEDAHEFLRYVIDACHNACVRLRKLQLQKKKGVKGGEGVIGDTIVKQIYGGALQNQIKCLTCGTESNKVDEIMDISLDILHSASLDGALNKFFEPESLDGINKYQCDNCKKLVAARKQMSILQAPNVLVIQLKRFEGIYGGKIDKSIAFEEVLVLSSYMCKGTQDPHPEYRLFGTIVHSGFSPDSGHYYAYVKDAMGRWYCCNDSHVTLSSVQEVLTEKPYILFFSRSKQRVSPSKTGLQVNGTKYDQSNGSDASKIPSSCQLERAENATSSDNHAALNNSKTSINKVPFGPSRKLDILGSETRKVPGNNGVIKFSIHKKEPFGKAHNLMKSDEVEKEKENVPIQPECMNNAVTNLGADVIDSENGKASTFINGNGRTHNDPGNSIGFSEGGIAKDLALSERRPDQEKLSIGDVKYGDVKCDSQNSGQKRKLELEDPCVLLVKDAQSRAEVEEFKKDIAKEASQFLRSCGWFDEVSNFMYSRKKLCIGEAKSSAPDILETDKRLLISEAKRFYYSKVPNSLKAILCERILKFRQTESREANGT